MLSQPGLQNYRMRLCQKEEERKKKKRKRRMMMTRTTKRRKMKGRREGRFKNIK